MCQRSTYQATMCSAEVVGSVQKSASGGRCPGTFRTSTHRSGRGANPSVCHSAVPVATSTVASRLRGMLERFMTTLDCVDTAFISDQTMDQLPLPSRLGKTRVGGVDLNNPRIRSALSAVLALAPSPAGFSATDFRAKVQSMTGQSDGDYTPRQAAYDLKKLRAKDL